MTLKKINPSDMIPLSGDQMQNFKGGAGACGAAEIFFPNNPVLNDIANTVVHWWETISVEDETSAKKSKK